VLFSSNITRQQLLAKEEKFKVGSTEGRGGGEGDSGQSYSYSYTNRLSKLSSPQGSQRADGSPWHLTVTAIE